MSQIIKNVLLTGEPGVGKTTIIRKIIQELSLDIGGFYTQEIKSGKTRKGFQLITTDGDQAILAHVNKKTSYKVGKYGVDTRVMTDLAVPALQRALKNNAVILIDEIGKMECFSIEFRDMVIRCLDSTKPVLGTIQNFASPLINQISNRPDVVRITVVEENRDSLPENIMKLLLQLLPEKKASGNRKKR